MIQRIQSLYLLLASMFYLLYSFFGFKYYSKGYFPHFNSYLEKMNLGDLSINFYIITQSLPSVIAIICFVAIFLFKKRIMQLRFSKIALYISIFMSIYTVIYFSVTLDDLLIYIQSQFVEILLYAAILNPFLSSLLIYLAIKNIKKDEKLVSGEGLIR